jgi:plasmid rolling circle replication initiator protein Rep
MDTDTAISESPMVFLSQISERDKPWDEHRTNASLVADLYQQAGLDHRALRMNHCADQLWFALQALETGELRLRLKSSRFCRQRFCPICQWRRMLMWRARFFKRLPTIIQDYPTHRWIFLTLTVENCKMTSLRTTMQTMSKAWNKFLLYKEFPATGWIRTSEVTAVWDCYHKGKFVGRHGTKWIEDYQRKHKVKLKLEISDEVHPHYHILMMVPSTYFGAKYLNNQRWRELWKQAIRSDYLPVVNVKTIKPQVGDTHPMARGILETVKYGVKESDLTADPQWLSELTSQMDKLKTVALGGVVRQYLKETEPEDLVHTDEDALEPELLEQYPTLLFDWKQIVQKYVQNQNIV